MRQERRWCGTIEHCTDFTHVHSQPASHPVNHRLRLFNKTCANLPFNLLMDGQINEWMVFSEYHKVHGLNWRARTTVRPPFPQWDYLQWNWKCQSIIYSAVGIPTIIMPKGEPESEENTKEDEWRHIVQVTIITNYHSYATQQQQERSIVAINFHQPNHHLHALNWPLSTWS